MKLCWPMPMENSLFRVFRQSYKKFLKLNSDNRSGEQEELWEAVTLSGLNAIHNFPAFLNSQNQKLTNAVFIPQHPIMISELICFSQVWYWVRVQLNPKKGKAVWSKGHSSQWESFHWLLQWDLDQDHTMLQNCSQVLPVEAAKSKGTTRTEATKCSVTAWSIFLNRMKTPTGDSSDC